MLLAAAAGPCDATTAMHAAVTRMLEQAAAAGCRGVRVVTSLLCACGGVLFALPPPPDDDDDGDVEGCSAGACACGCAPSVRLGWSGRLWCTLQVRRLCCMCRVCERVLECGGIFRVAYDV